MMRLRKKPNLKLQEKNPTLKKEVDIKTQETLRIPKQPLPDKDLSIDYSPDIKNIKQKNMKNYTTKCQLSYKAKHIRITSISYQQL